MHSVAAWQSGFYLRVVAAAAVVWGAKGVALFAANASPVLYWSGYVVWVALAVAGVLALVSAAKRFGAGRAAVLFTVLLGAPFFFDLHAVIAMEAPGRAPLFASLAFVVGVFILSLVRLFSLTISLAFLKRSAGRFRWLLSTVTVLSLEAATLAFFPLLYFASVPFPVPPARGWEEGNAALVHESNRVESNLYVFVDPGTNNARRLELSRLALESPDAFANQIQQDLSLDPAMADIFAGPKWRRTVLLFPETFLNLSGSSFRALHASLQMVFGPHTFDTGFEVLLGSRFGDSNVVFRGYTDERLGRLKGGVVAAKSTFVPFYEVPWLGVSVRSDDVSRALHASSDEWLVSPVGSAAGKTALICYEALFPWSWKVGGDVLVLTNHDLFSKPGTASVLYDFTLRQLASATMSNVFLVANKGTSGIFVNPFGRRDDQSEKSAFVVSSLQP